MWTLWYQKKINLLNTSASARSSLRAKRRVRAACVYPAKFSKKNIVIVIFPNLQNRSEVPLHIVLPSTHPRIIHSAYSCQVVKELLSTAESGVREIAEIIVSKRVFFSMSSANWMWWDLCFEPWIAQNVSCRAYALSLWACDVILNYLCVVCWEERAWWVSTTDYTWLNKEEQYWKDACRLPFCATTFTKFIHSFWFKIRKILLPMKKMNISQF